MLNVTLRYVLITIVAVCVCVCVCLCVCVCSLVYPAHSAHAPYCIVVFGLSGFTVFFSHYHITGTIFAKKLLSIKRVF